MTVTRFSTGLALLAATACAQIPVDAPVYAPPYKTTGASSVSYDPPVLLRPAPPVVAASPTAPPPPAAPTYRAPTYGMTAPLPQSRMSYEAAAPRPLPAPPPPATFVPAAPAPTAAPAMLATAPAPARPVRAAPSSVAMPAALPAPEAETRELTVRERVAVFGTREPEPPRSTGGRQFRIIENAELDTAAGRSGNGGGSRFGDVQITSAEPFSIRTDTGKPYYLGSTPPAIEYQIPHIPQEEPLWCWAAAAQQAIGWVNNGRAPSQCAIVALAHGMDVQACCADREGICARTGEIPAIEKLVERFGGQARELATVPRDPKVIYDILRAGDTLLIRLRPAPHEEAVGIRHMIVVRGVEWLRLPNNQLQATLLYNDPLGAGERAVNFDEIEGFFEQALVISRS